MVMTDKTRAVIYVRVSGDDRKTTGSLNAQIEACEAYCKRKGYSVIEVISEDERKLTSGAKDDLPGMGVVIELARAKAFDVLVVHKIDRFARNRFKHISLKNLFSKHGVNVEYASLELGDDKESRLMESLLADFAEYERELIVERTVAGQLRSVNKGNVRQSSFITFGYITGYDGDRKVLIINEAEAKIVRLIFRLYVEEFYTIYRIAKYLEERKIRKPSGRPGNWSHGTLHNILRNETYVGRWYFNKARSAGGHKRIANDRENWLMVEVPAIIEEDTFNRAQELLKANKRTVRRKHFYLLTGFMTCGVCGYSVSGLTKPSGLQYYVCSARHGKGRNRPEGPCPSPFYHAAEIDACVWDWLSGLNEETIEAKLHEYNVALREKHRNGVESIEANEAHIAQLENENSRLVTAYASGVISLDDLARGKAPIDEQIKNLRLANDKLRELLPVEGIFKEYAKESRRVLDHILKVRSNQEKQKALFQELGFKLTFDGDHILTACVLGDTIFTVTDYAGPSPA